MTGPEVDIGTALDYVMKLKVIAAKKLVHGGTVEVAQIKNSDFRTHIADVGNYIARFSLADCKFIPGEVKAFNKLNKGLNSKRVMLG